jgi:ribonuclease HI
LKGVQLLKEGLVRRVGDGTTIQLWSDPWLPREWSRQPITPRGQTIISKVSELIDPYSGSWDVQLVQSIFLKQDVDLILAIPLREEMEDEWAWHYEPKGIFTVKSAYKLSRKLQEVALGQPGCSNFGPGSGFCWQSIWKAPCTLKIQQFLWRFAHNSLPVRMNIKRRGMDIDTICPVCQRLDEDGAHLFLKCKPVKQLWTDLGLEDLRLDQVDSLSPKDLIECLLAAPEEKKILGISLLWNWWSTRNKVNAEGQTLKLQTTLFQIRKSAREFKDFFVKVTVEQLKPVQKWRRPEGDILKINIDGSFNQKDKSGGWGFIIRDADGDAVGSGAGKLEHLQDPLQAEAEACIHAMEWAREWGMTKVTIETDAQLLQHAITGNTYDLAPNGVLFREIKAFSRLNFSSFSLLYCSRECNKIADFLADYGSKMVNVPQAVWPGHAPTFVHDLVSSDLAGASV